MKDTFKVLFPLDFLLTFSLLEIRDRKLCFKLSKNDINCRNYDAFWLGGSRNNTFVLYLHFFCFFFPLLVVRCSFPATVSLPSSPILPCQGRGRCILARALASASLVPLAGSRRNGAPWTSINVLYYISVPAEASPGCCPRPHDPLPACTLSTALGEKFLEQKLRPPSSLLLPQNQLNTTPRAAETGFVTRAE